MKRVAFCTFGCRLNQYDTESLRVLLEGEDGGWHTVPFDDEADVYVVNTCSVTARADSRARNMIRRIHRERPTAQIVATGCYAQRAPQEVAALEGIALVLGTADRPQAPREFARLSPAMSGAAVEPRVAVSPIEDATDFQEVQITEMHGRTRAFVKIQEGCDGECTFCIIPSTRGRSRSRERVNVIAQVRELLNRGTSEIVLTGVHLGRFGADGGESPPQLESLIAEVLEMDGLDRLRISSIEPRAISEELVALCAQHEKFAPHFHVAMQSGSDEILTRMKRDYSIGEFEERIYSLHEAIPECGIGTDVICGFPGESDEHFQETFDRIVALPITYLHPFTYSVRPGSAAETFSGQVPGDERKRRTRALKKLSRDKSRAFRERHVGKTHDVLLEPTVQGGEPHLGGLTGNYLRVDLGPGETTQRMVTARLDSLNAAGLCGTIVNAGETVAR